MSIDLKSDNKANHLNSVLKIILLSI